MIYNIVILSHIFTAIISDTCNLLFLDLLRKNSAYYNIHGEKTQTIRLIKVRCSAVQSFEHTLFQAMLFYYNVT